jgi:hypothetical protein
MYNGSTNLTSEFLNGFLKNFLSYNKTKLYLIFQSLTASVV